MSAKSLSVGARIREARQRAGLTANQLGERVGRDRQTVYRWEWGSVEPSLDLLEKLAGALGVTVGSLFGEAPFPEDGSGPSTLSR